MLDELQINSWIAMAEVGHISEYGIIPLFIAAGMKAGPVTNKFLARRLK
jgi:hypothetical protein